MTAKWLSANGCCERRGMNAFALFVCFSPSLNRPHIVSMQEEAQRRAERERKRGEALRQLEIWSEEDNLLKRPTDFLCKMKFLNTLPDPPVEPKLLDVQWPLERLVVYGNGFFSSSFFSPLFLLGSGNSHNVHFSFLSSSSSFYEFFYRYAPTSLERDYRHEMLLNNTLGIPVDMVRPFSYLLPEKPGKLAPQGKKKRTKKKIWRNDSFLFSLLTLKKKKKKDEELLAAEKDALAGRQGRTTQRVSVPWLRPSEYITSRFDEKLYGQNVGARGGVDPILNQVVQKSAKGDFDARVAFAKAAADVVTQQFERTNDGTKPVHPTNPALKPVSIQPIYPNQEYLCNTLVHVLYEDVPLVEKDASLEREQALLLPVVWDPTRPEKTGYVRVLPNDEDDDLDELFGGADEEEAPKDTREYHKTSAYDCHLSKTATWRWVREGVRDRKAAEEGESKYVLVWGEGVEIASYVPFDLKFDLHDFTTMNRGTIPKVGTRYKVAKRELEEEAMEQERQEKYLKLYGEEEEEEAEAMREGDDIDLEVLREEGEPQHQEGEEEGGGGGGGQEQQEDHHHQDDNNNNEAGADGQ